MQLKWNHRFVPFTSDANSQRSTPVADRSDTASPMALQPAQSKPNLQPSPAQATTSPALNNIGANNQPQPSQQLAPALPPQLVTATCGNPSCRAQIGTLINSWSQITNSYYTQTQPSYRAVGLRPKGDVKPPSTLNSIISGCLIQTLVCSSCSETLGFFCAEAPDHKAIFRNRQFLKLAKVNLTSQTTKTLVSAYVEKPLDDNHRPSMDTSAPETVNSRIAPMSPITPTAETGDCTDADLAAVKGTNDGSYTWREAHEIWYSRTKFTLSPGAFGKRILKLGGGMKPKAAISQVPPPPQPIPASQPSHPHAGHRPSNHYASVPSLQHVQSQTSLPPIHAAVSRSISYQGEAPPLGSVDPLRRDIPRETERLDVAVMRLQSLVEGLNASVDALRQEVRSRPRVGGANLEDQSTIDLLSDTVSNLSSKAGEVDGIKLQMEALKRRVKRVEEASGAGPSTPSAAHTHDLFHRSGAVEQRYESPFPMIQPLHSASNGLKRPNGLQSYDAPDVKRARPDVYADHHPPSSIPYSSQQPQYMPLTNGDDNRGQDLHGHTPNHYTPRRGPGRPRKYPTPDTHNVHAQSQSQTLPPAPWEHEHWAPAPETVDGDGFYRPLAPGPGSVDSERGRLIRRGTLGGALAIDNKRTRQRPIRNSDGVLIRKDGKPDMRSVSSAQNLKRFYDRKMAGEGGEGMEMHHNGSGSASPMASNSHRGSGDPANVNADSGNDTEQDYVDNEDDIGHEQYQDPNSATSAESEHGPFHSSHGPSSSRLPPLADAPQQQRQDERHHQDIMAKMFPHGMSGERTRLDEATAQLFDPGERTTTPAKLQTRDAVVKRELVEEGSADTPAEGPAPQTPVAAHVNGTATAAVDVPLNTELAEEDTAMPDCDAAPAEPVEGEATPELPPSLVSEPQQGLADVPAAAPSAAVAASG